MKRVLLLSACFVLANHSEAQFLKKLKDKVNKTINKDTDQATKEEENAGNEEKNNARADNNSNDNNDKVAWCDRVKADATGADGVSYTKIYSSPGKTDIEYTESSLGRGNDHTGYRLILTERANNKQQFVVIENGKVIDRAAIVKPQYLDKGNNASSAGGANEAESKKYLIADSSSHTLPKTKAKSVTIQEVDEDQSDMALNILRQTDEYKQMSAAEQKEMEANMKKGIDYNNSMAGKTIHAPAQNGGSFSVITGYKLVVKGKTYGKFMMPPAFGISRDESAFLAIGLDEKAAPVMITPAKKILLDKTKFTGVGGQVLRSPDHKKLLYIEQKQLTEKEMQDYSTGNYKMVFNVLRGDGTVFTLNDYSGSAKFKLTNTGSAISVNESTGEVYADNKKIGKFNVSSGDHIESDAVIIGSTQANMCYYDGSSGSLTYLDGSVKKLGVVRPSVITQNGKTYMTWFRKCRNDIYIGKFSY